MQFNILDKFNSETNVEKSGIIEEDNLTGSQAPISSPSRNAVSFAAFVRRDPLQIQPSTVKRASDEGASKEENGTHIDKHLSRKQMLEELNPTSLVDIAVNTVSPDKHKKPAWRDNAFSGSYTPPNRYIFGSPKNDRLPENWLSLSDDPSVYPFLTKRDSFGRKAGTSDPTHMSDCHVSPASKYRFNIKQIIENESSRGLKEEIEDFVDNSQLSNWGEGCPATEVHMSTDPSDNLDQDCSASSYLSDVEAPQSPVHPGTSAQTPGGGSACTTNVCTTESHPISGNISIMELAQNPNFLSHTRNSHDMPLVSPMQWLNGVKIPTALTTSTNDHQRKRKYMMRGGYEERLVNLLIREKSDHAIWAHGLRREATERNPSLYVEVYHVKETYGSIICRCRLLPLDAINEKATHIDLPPLEDEFIDILLCMELDPSHSTLASRHSTQPDHAIHVGDLLKIYKPYQEFTFGSSSILDDWEIPRNGLIVTRFVVRSSDVSDRDKPI